MSDQKRPTKHTSRKKRTIESIEKRNSIVEATNDATATMDTSAPPQPQQQTTEPLILPPSIPTQLPSWLPSFITRRSTGTATDLTTLPPKLNEIVAPIPSLPTNLPSSTAASKLERVTSRLKSLRHGVHASDATLNTVVVTPWPSAQPAMPNANGNSSKNDSNSAAAASSSSLPSASTLVVSITTLLPYTDLSEVSGIVLCPGFTRCSAISATAAAVSHHSSSPHDPVPSHQHPESISPTILPPLPTPEERKQAQENANAQNAEDEEANEKKQQPGGDITDSTVASKPVTQQLGEIDHSTSQAQSSSLTTKIMESLSRLTNGGSAAPTTNVQVLPAIAASAPSIPIAPSVPLQPTAASPATSATTQPVPPLASTAASSASTSILSRFSRRSTTTPATSTTTLDSISATTPPTAATAATSSVTAAPLLISGDADTELAIRPSSAAPPAATTKRTNSKPAVTTPSKTAETIAQKRANSLMQQLWLFGQTSSNAEKEEEKNEQPTTQQSPTTVPTTTAPTIASQPVAFAPTISAPPTSSTSLPPASPPPIVPAAVAPESPLLSAASRLGSFLRTSAHTASSLASSALYWTLGPFDAHSHDAALAAAASIAPAATSVSPSVLPFTPPPPPPVYQTIRKVVIIGVHGWSLMGGMLGEKPIVVSNKFCTMTQRALATFCKEKGVSLDQIQVCTIPLHGHGKVEQRVETYLQHQLPIFQPYITTADAIFVVAHSQGVLVSVSLLHQLIIQGWIDPEKQHVSMQLMAGLHHGPFPDLLWDLYAATKELFSYCYVDSDVHRRYMQALHYLLEHSVKILCIGSIHDQAVPLYSSLLQSFPSHPNLLRGVYIDYSTYQPDFLYALLSLVVYLMNTGSHGRAMTMSDEAAAQVYVEALVHISGFLRGGILEKNGGAHSAIHRLTDCYNLGVEWSLSGRGVSTPVHVHTHSFAAWAPYFQESFTHTKMNRYMMVLRFRELCALLPHTQLDAHAELTRLYQLYTTWQPRTKQLKQLKGAFARLFDVHEDAITASLGANSDSASQSSSKETNTNSPALSNEPGSASPPSSAPILPPISSSVDRILQHLLTPPRLPVLPVPLPTSWQMNAENAMSTAASLAEQLTPASATNEPNGNTSASSSSSASSAKRNKRLRHVKEISEEEANGIVDTKSEKPAPSMAPPTNQNQPQPESVASGPIEALKRIIAPAPAAAKL